MRDACPNRTLIELLESLGKKTLRLRRIAMSISGRTPISHAECQDSDGRRRSLANWCRRR
jgi:hypothetical protein